MQYAARVDQSSKASKAAVSAAPVRPARSSTEGSLRSIFPGSLRHSGSGGAPNFDAAGSDVQNPSSRLPSQPRLSQHSTYSRHSIGHAERTAFAEKLRHANAESTTFKHRRDAILNDSEFQWKTFDPADDYYWEDPYRSLEQADTVNTLECWNYEGTNNVDRTDYVRFLEAGDARHFGPDDKDDPSQFDKRFERWLNGEGDFGPLRPNGAGTLKGGLRLALCDRPLMDLGMTIRKEISVSIEKSFDLHEATLRAFADKGGCFSLFVSRNTNGDLQKLHIVVKAVQKVEITNCLLSLTYSVSDRWTNAFACGDSLVLGQGSDEVYGSQKTQLLDAVASASKHTCTNPLAIPVALLQMCASRALIRSGTLEQQLIGVERALGVVNAGWVLIKKDRPEWPLDIDVKRQTRELHSTLPQILFLKAVVQWQKRYAAWLIGTAEKLQLEQALADQRCEFEDLINTINMHASSIDGMLEFFEGMEGRTQSQINLLFSVVGQIDAINSQNANKLNLEVARSTKEDSISMSTFTFITAIFLPGSFIATVFSTGMFEWMASDPGNGGEGVISRRFWIFWAIAIPLTAITLAGWYGWYQHANRDWRRKLDQASVGSAKTAKECDARSESDDEDPSLKAERRQRREVETEYEKRLRWEEAQARKEDRRGGLLPGGVFRWKRFFEGTEREKTDTV